MSEKRTEAEACVMRLLARRDHSTGELRAKLKSRQFEPDVIEDVISTLVSDGWVDDRKFATHQAEILARKAWGPIQIRGKLRNHGVDGDTAADAVDELDVDWLALAKERLASKYGHPLSSDDRERAFRHLTYRGFSSGVARRAVFED